MPSLIDAINEKYGQQDNDTLFDQIPVAIHVPKKSARWYVPKLLVLNDCNIDTAGFEQQLRDKCALVEDLDIAQNNLFHWQEVFTILRVMPKLKFANLSFNDLTKEIMPTDINNSLSFRNLKSIVLNATRIPWTNVRFILSLLPNLQELHLSLNEYRDIELDYVHDASDNDNTLRLDNLKVLHFTANPIDNWKDVRKLGNAFPQLESLVLAECPLSCLNSLNEIGDSFKKLRFLNISNTLLDNWNDIDTLATFPSLTRLRVLGCPLFHEYTKHERRQLLIARLPNVRVLNGGGEIGLQEREDAERAFIRYYVNKLERDCPQRYNELLEIHGRLEPLINISLKPQRKVKITLVYENELQDRTIDVYQTVCELKHKLQATVGIAVGRMRLFYVNQHMRTVTGPEEMKFPNKQLYSYNIQTGDEIIVDSRN